MGGGGKGTTQTTQKMEIPPEVMARYNAVNARAETVAQQPFQAYSNNPNAFVAPLTQTQQAGIQNTNYMAGAAQPFYQAGAGLTAAGAQNVNPSALNVGQYYNPFTQAVAAPTLQALQQQQAVERSSLVNPQTARSFGGDRSGIVQANLARQQDLATAQAMAPIYQNAFTQALGAAQQQQGVGLAAEQANANRLLQAGGQFGQLGTGAQQAGLAGAQAQLAAGQTEQQTQQAGLQALYNQWQQQQAFPFQLTQFLSNIATGTGALSGNTTSGTQQGGGGFFSDERLKENIEKVGKTNDGQNIYRYNYKGDPRTQIGLLAQEVAQDHPDAVGKRDGYLTVDYRDATNDAVRDHKAAGGPEVGMDAYNINAPSAMLSGPGVGLGGMQLPQMIGGGGLAIQPGAINPAAQGMLAPKATGYSLGSKEGAQAELASLRGADMDKSQSGQAYFDYKTKALDDFLKNYDNSSQGGLVSGPGAFSRGGYATEGYVNPALAYYSPKAAQAGLMGAGGPYGAALSPAQAQMLKAAELRFPQQKSGVEQANQIANITSKGAEAWGARPDFLRSKEDIAKREQAALANQVKEKQLIEQGYEKGLIKKAELPSDTETAARGGLIARQHHNTTGYVTPSAAIYGNPEDENNTLGATLSAPLEKREMMQPGKMAQHQEGPSGAQQLGQTAGLLKSGKSAYDFAAKKLAGDAAAKTGTTAATTAGQTAGQTAATTAATTAGQTAATAAPIAEGVAAAAAPAAEAATGLAAGAAGAAEGAGILGTLGTAAGTIGEGIMAILPFIGLSDERAKTDIEKVGKLNDGQPVYRFKYKGDDKTRMGLIAQDVERDHPEAVKGLGGLKMVDYKKATNDAVRQHHADGERVVSEGQKEEPSFLSSLGDAVGSVAGGLGKVATGVGDTLKKQDESFWVPAIAGLGSMLASRNPTLFGAIGEGLVGGASAYTNVQKQTAEQLAKRLELSKGRFTGPHIKDGQKVYYDTIVSDYVPEVEMQRRQAQYIGPNVPGASRAPAAATNTTPPPKADAEVVDAAKKVLEGSAPKIEKRPAVVTPPPTATPEAKVETPVQSEEPVTPAKPAAPPAGTEVKAESDIMKPPPSKEELMNAALGNQALWKNYEPEQRPAAMMSRAAELEREARQAKKDAEMVAENEVAAKRYTDLANTKSIEATQKRDAARKLLEDAISSDWERSQKITAAQVELQMAGPKSAEALKAEIAKLKETQPLLLEQEEKKISFTENYKRQQKAIEEAAREARDGINTLNQANAIMNVAFDKEGKPTFSGGPLGSRVGQAASLFQQVGFSPEFVKDFLGTDPRNAQALDKLQTAMASEVARLELAGSPVRVTEFNQFLATTPGQDLLPESLKWIVNDVIKPRAQSMIGSYEAVKKLDPGKDNIEATLFDYRSANPWFSPNTEQIGTSSSREPAKPPVAAEDAAAELARRRAARQGVQ